MTYILLCLAMVEAAENRSAPVSRTERLQKIEKGLEKINRLTTHIGNTSIVSSLDLGRFNENDPAQTGVILETIVKIGTVVERLNTRAKPTLRRKAEEIVSEENEETKRVKDRYEEIRQLNKRGHIPQDITERAIKSMSVFKASRINQSERILSAEGKLTETETAIMAASIAEAYAHRNDEGISLDDKFWGLFGRIYRLLPHDETGKLDMFFYNEAKIYVAQKVAFNMDAFNKDELSEEAKSLLSWIETNIKDKDIFYKTVTKEENCLNGSTIVDLRKKYRNIFQARLEEAVARRKQETEAETEERRKREAKLVEEKKTPKKRGGSVKSEIEKEEQTMIALPPETVEAKPTKPSELEETLSFLYKNINNPDIRANLNEAIATTPSVQGKATVSRQNAALALYNFEHRRATGKNLTDEEIKKVKKIIRQITTKPKK